MEPSPPPAPDPRPKHLPARLTVWICGLLLGAAMASFFASKVYAMNETMRSLGGDDAIWAGDEMENPEWLALWTQLSLVAIVICAVAYLGAIVRYHFKKR